MTGLSYLNEPQRRVRGIFELARASLLLGVMLAPVGCLVSDPPLYQEPPPTPPVFDLSNAIPLPGEVFVVRRSPNAPTILTFTIPFRSEDRGDGVQAALHLDYNTLSAQATFTKAQTSVDASTFDDLTRVLSLRWPLPPNEPSPGCHTLTVLASHQSTFDDNEFRPHIVRAQNDRAVAVWWVNFDPPEDDPYTLRDCPSPADTEID